MNTNWWSLLLPTLSGSSPLGTAGQVGSGAPWRHVLAPRESHDPDTPRCSEGLDLEQLVQHTGAPNTVQKRGSPKEVRQETLTTASFLPPCWREWPEGSFILTYGPDIKTESAEVPWEPKQTWGHTS